MNDGEKRVVRRLVKAALDRGYTVSVHDGEEWPVRKSDSVVEIMAALGATDMERLLLRSADGTRIGSILLVYGNSPEEVIADHTDNELIQGLVLKAEAVAA